MLQLIPNKYWSTPDIWDKTELTTTVALKFTRSLNFFKFLEFSKMEGRCNLKETFKYAYWGIQPSKFAAESS